MRVLILGLGGVSRHFRNWPERTLGQALVRAGHEVHAITYWQPDSPQLGLEQREETIDGIQVHRVRPQFFPARDLLAALAALPRPDVAHLFHPRNILAWRAVRWLKTQGVPVVWTWNGPYHDRWLVADRERPYEHEPQPENLIYSLPGLLRRTLRDGRARDHMRNYFIHEPLRHVDAFIPCSRHEAQVMAQLGFGDRPITVVPQWLDMDFMNGPAPNLAPPLTRPIIPYIGQLMVRKCYDMVIEAMPAVVARCPQASVVFVTHNPEQRADLQRMADERGMATNLRFLGMISDGENGLLIPYDDSAALARAILAVLGNADLRARLVAGGRDTLATRFVPQQLAERDRKSTRLNSSHVAISYAVFCLQKKTTHEWCQFPLRSHNVTIALPQAHLSV